MNQVCADLETVADYVRYAITQFNQHDLYYGHGTSNAWEEAQRLVFTALALPLELSQEESRLFYPCKLTLAERTVINDWIDKRAQDATPLPYISQQAWFAGMPFYVDERVLIPRSPFAELINKGFTPYLTDTPKSILDMCTGGACIAIALAAHFEEAQIDAVDIDANALEVASINIQEYQLEHRVFPIQSDLFENLKGQQYDLLVVNPPYVDAEDMNDLPQEYLHEPELALASGVDGLDLTQKLLTQVVDFMSDDAWLFIEVGNSEVNFTQRFGDLNVSWWTLEQGGSGIFAINKQQLLAQQDKILSL